MVVSFAVLRSIDPLHLFEDNARLFSSMNEVLYVVFGFAIGYIPIGIVNIIKRRLV